MNSLQRFTSSLLSVGLLLLTTVGCMVEPGDKQVYADRTKPIPCSGFTVFPGQTIELLALNPSTNNWDLIGETVSESATFEYFDSKWIFWKTEIVVPKSYWSQWGKDGGYSAILKAVADKNDLFTFQEGFYNYYEDYASLEELYLENKSTTGVEILVWAEN